MIEGIVCSKCGAKLSRKCFSDLEVYLICSEFLDLICNDCLLEMSVEELSSFFAELDMKFVSAYNYLKAESYYDL